MPSPERGAGRRRRTRRRPQARQRQAAANASSDQTLVRAAAIVWPERPKLGEDRLAERVARPGQRVRRVRVQALERPRARLGATDSERELGTEPPLLLVRLLEARRELRILSRACTPPLDAPGCLEPRDRGDERRARQVEGRRERLARFVV